MTDLSDCRCVRCGTSFPSDPGRLPDDAGIVADAIRCAACGAAYDWVWGVPFFGDFERSEFAGLFEIAANIEAPQTFTPELLASWHHLLASYHEASDKTAFLAGIDQAKAPYVPNRYNEWVELHTLTDGHDFRGTKVLDVGAGAGFDSYRHVLAGAEVTALEFSPILARQGRIGLPMIRWIGGFSHALPFATGAFDYVFCNAALHHMRDIPASIAEMLRVLKPGGWLFTTSDSYRPDHAGEDYELNIFDANPAVLAGVNERIPRLAEFLTTPLRHRDRLTPRIFTHMVYGAPTPAGGREDIDGFRPWDFDTDRNTLGQTAGTIAQKIRLDRPIDEPPRLQTERGLRPAELAGWLGDHAEAMGRLAAWTPSAYVNTPFPGERADKFHLLNGWQKPTGAPWRRAYRRSRWYLQRKAAETHLRFDVCAEAAAEFRLLVNGVEAYRGHLRSGAWTSFCVDLRSLPATRPFAVELQCNGGGGRFEDDCFRVRRRKLTGGVRARIGTLLGARPAAAMAA